MNSNDKETKHLLATKANREALRHSIAELDIDRSRILGLEESKVMKLQDERVEES